MGNEIRSPRRRPCGTCGDSGWILLEGGSGFGGGPCPMGCAPRPPAAAPASYACPFPGCGAVSHHPADVANQFCSTCHRRAGDLLGLVCPGCRRPAAFRIVGQQAFCGHDDCKVLAWTPELDASQLANSYVVDLVDRSEKSSG